MAIGAIAKADMFSNTWECVYDMLNANLTDPRGRSKWIYASFPKLTIDNVTDYPIIVVPPVQCPSTTGLTLSDYEAILFVTVEVYSTNPTQMDTLVDDIFEVFDTKESTFADTNKLRLMRVEGTDYAHYDRGKFSVHVKSTTYVFKYNYTSSA